MNQLKAVIFDMDGVIFDSEKLYMQCCIEAAKIYGANNIEKVVLGCIGLNTENTMARYRNVYGDDFPLEDFWKEATSRFAEKAQGGLLPVKTGAKEILRYLNDKNVPVALASSTKTEMVLRELTEAGLKEHFSVIVGGDMVTKSKPQPDIFLFAAKKLGIDPVDCAVIEDSLNGIRAAAASGGFVIMVPDLVYPTQEEILQYTDVVLSSLTEVHRYFEENKLLVKC